MPHDEDTPIFTQLAAEQLFELDPPPSQLPPPGAGDEAGPPDTHDAGLSGHLGTVTDFEWFAAHERLTREADEDLAPELDHIWDPARPGAAFLDPAQRDMAPAAGRYDPGADERFHGGGFIRGK